MIDHCSANRLPEHFLEFMKKEEFYSHLMLNIGMDVPNINLNFQDLLQSSEVFDQLDTTILSIGTCPLHVTHNGFRDGVKNLNFNVDTFPIDINSFFSNFELYTEQIASKSKNQQMFFHVLFKSTY